MTVVGGTRNIIKLYDELKLKKCIQNIIKVFVCRAAWCLANYKFPINLMNMLWIFRLFHLVMGGVNLITTSILNCYR